MRIARLDLTRYGLFTDATLDFGRARDCDVTVVYGDNEAGKSTAFAAWLDLLFTIPLRTSYSFLHPRPGMEVGALVETPAGPLHLRRTAKGLMDGAGNALDEARVAKLVHGLDREGYAQRFSLDDERLRRGGEEIASGKGDLGAALFAGLTGIEGMDARLAQVGARVDAFHKPRGKTTALATAKRDLADLDTQLRETGLRPQEWDRLRGDLDAAAARADAAAAEVIAADRALTLCQAVADLRRIARERAEVEARLTDAPEGPDLAPDAERRMGHALSRLATAADDRATWQVELDTAEAVLRDAPGAEVEAAIARIDAARLEDGTSLVHRTEGEAADLPRRQAALAEALRKRDAALAQAGAPSMPAIDAARLEEIEARLSDWREADRAAGQARAGVEADRAALPPEVAPVAGIDALQAALDALPGAERLADRREAARLAGQAAEDAAQGLPEGWRALAEAKGGLPEDAGLEALAEAHRAASDALAQARAVAVRADAEVDGRQLSLRDPKAAAVTDAERDAARDARDAAWDRHRAALEAATADAFAEAMRTHDRLRDRHAESAEARATRVAAEADLARAQLAAAQAAEGVARAEAELTQQRGRVAKVAPGLGLPADADPRDLPRRRARLAEALRAAVMAERAEAEAADLDRAADAAEARLQAALREAGGGEGDAAAARAHLERLRKAETAATLRREAEARLTRAEAEAATLERKAAAAGEAAREALADLWCAEGELEEAVRMLPFLRRAVTEEAERARMEVRVEQLASALDRLEGLAKDLPGEGRAPERLARLRPLVEAAGKARAKAAEARMHLATQDRREREAREAIDAVLAGQGGEGSSEDRLALCLARDGDRAALVALGARAAELRAGVDGDALAREQAADPAGRADVLAAAQEAARAAHGAALQAQGAARQALEAAQAGQGGDAARQARATLLARLRDEAREAAALMLGGMAARRALRRMQEERRGEMIAAAETAFARLTGGAWTRLETEPGERGGEELWAIGDGRRVRIDGLSTGTRGQIYLALRLAGHAGFVAQAGPLPFILDDVAETFDDTRARATLDMLGELGGRGQAILFTHHRHLVDMARAALPGVRVENLPRRLNGGAS
ncbi:AAA family ATPase [Jannaschia rubra]|uniref:AAA family ATPase n=2 Tax=Jannaschia rubra TaxID=282197 RepID=UPI0008ECF0BC|nr:AAA family ATPase [Jannaschia rubra]SFG71449.1 Uncharacterized protein YhaN [Jannaschia rubra]